MMWLKLPSLDTIQIHLLKVCEIVLSLGVNDVVGPIEEVEGFVVVELEAKVVVVETVVDDAQEHVETLLKFAFICS